MMYVSLWVYLLVATFFLLLQFACIDELDLPLATAPIRSNVAMVLAALLWPVVLVLVFQSLLREIIDGVR